MPRFRLPFRKEDFFFSQREKRLFFLAVRAGIGLVAVSAIILIVAGIVASGSRPSEEAQTEREPAAVSLTEGGGFSKPLGLNSFIIPDESLKGAEPEFFLLRTRVGKWNQMMVGKYWISPSKIGLENLSLLNDKNIKRLFESVE